MDKLYSWFGTRPTMIGTFTKKLFRQVLIATLLFGFFSLDFSAGDLRYDVGNWTVRHWNIVPAVTPACALVKSGGQPCGSSGAATSYSLTGPSNLTLNQASSNYTLLANGSTSAIVTPSDASHSGIFTPATINLANTSPVSFTYIPLQTGTFNISTTNGGGLSNPSPISVTIPNLAPGYPGMLTGWSVQNGSTFTTGVTGGPFGAANAASVQEDASNGYHDIVSSTITLTANQSYLISAIIKQSVGTRNVDVVLIEPGSTAAVAGVFNPSNGTFVGDSSWGGASIASTASRSLGSGWFLVQMQGTLGNFTSATFNFFMDADTGVGTYQGDNSSTVLVNGPAIQ